MLAYWRFGGALVVVFALCTLGCSESGSDSDSQAQNTHQSVSSTWPIPPLDQVRRITFTRLTQSVQVTFTISAEDSVRAIVDLLEFEQAEPCYCKPIHSLSLDYIDGFRRFRINDHKLEFVSSDSTAAPRSFKVSAELWSLLQQIGN